MQKISPRCTLLLAVASLLTGCATEGYVDNKTAALNARVISESLRFDNRVGALDDKVSGLDARVGAIDERLAKTETGLSSVSRQALEALDKATAASKQASGKLLYEVTLTEGNIKFTSATAKLDKASQQALASLAAKLKADNRNVFIEIQGHTDRVGDPDENKLLGLDRAEAVRDALYAAGIPLHRMSVISFGGSQPAVKGNSKKALAENRRVVLRVLN